MHVLVVDDEIMIRVNLMAYLEDEGFDVQCAESGEDALELLRSQRFDVGIIDMRLPGMDGNAFILRAHALDAHMRFIIHTGSTEYRVPEKLKRLGVNDEQILLKPLSDMSKIVEKIDWLLGRSLMDSAECVTRQ